MKNIADLQKMMKTAKDMQDRLQKELAEMRLEGTSGGDVVSVILDGQKNLVSLKLDKETVAAEDVDMLQDLIVAAFHDATAKVDEKIGQKLGALGAGLKIPGLF